MASGDSVPNAENLRTVVPPPWRVSTIPATSRPRKASRKLARLTPSSAGKLTFSREVVARQTDCHHESSCKSPTRCVEKYVLSGPAGSKDPLPSCPQNWVSGQTNLSVSTIDWFPAAVNRSKVSTEKHITIAGRAVQQSRNGGRRTCRIHNRQALMHRRVPCFRASLDLPLSCRR